MRNAQEEFYYLLTHFSVDLYYFFGYDQKETNNNNLLTIGANLSYNVKFTEQFRV